MKTTKKLKEMTQDEKRAKWREYYRGYDKAKLRQSRNRRYREDAEFRERTKKRNLARYYARKAERAKQ